MFRWVGKNFEGVAWQNIFGWGSKRYSGTGCQSILVVTWQFFWEGYGAKFFLGWVAIFCQYFAKNNLPPTPTFFTTSPPLIFLGTHLVITLVCPISLDVLVVIRDSFSREVSVHEDGCI